MDETKIYSADFIDEVAIKKMLRDVIDILDERGYNPIEQIIGYLISGDPGYISSHKEARKKIVQFDRTHILEVLLKNYVKR